MMKKFIIGFSILFLNISAFAQKGSRPYYGGGHHSTSHGGDYPGSTNSHHKGGHYQNYSSNNRYGIHSTSRKRRG